MEVPLSPPKPFLGKLLGYLAGGCKAEVAPERSWRPAVHWTQPVSPLSSSRSLVGTHGVLVRCTTPQNTPPTNNVASMASMAIKEWLIFGHDFGTSFIYIYIKLYKRLVGWIFCRSIWRSAISELLSNCQCVGGGQTEPSLNTYV